MKIKVKWSVSKESGTETILLTDLDVKSEKQWNKLKEGEKEALIQKYLDNIPDQPYMVIDSYE